MNHAQKYSGHIWLPLILLVVLWADCSGRLDGLNNLVTEQRMKLVKRSATSDIVYLTIDKKSLDQLGVWPWPRSKTAEIVNELVQIGVRDIMLDLDLSMASTPGEDRQLANALKNADGAVILPIENRDLGLEQASTGAGLVGPIAMFRTHARLAYAGVPIDHDGSVRTLPMERLIDGRFVPSIAAALSRDLREPGSGITLDFSISPRSVPTYSAVDLLNSELDLRQFEGKSVLVGTLGIRQDDSHVVPVHGIVPGSVLQLLGAETLLQDRNLRCLPSTPFVLSFAALLFCLARSRQFSELSHQLIICFLLAAIVVAAGMFLQRRFAIILPTAPVQLLLWLYAVSRSLNELTIRRWKMLQTSMEASNMRHMLTRIISDSSDAILVVDEFGDVLETSHRAPEIFDFSLKPHDKIILATIVPRVIAAGARQCIQELRNGRSADADDRNPKFLELNSGRSIEYTITPSCLSNRRQGKSGKNWYVACITARDVTEKRHQEARLEYMSRFDDLTGAMRRAEFLRRLDSHILRRDSDAGGRQVVFALNLHRFKTINATLGRAVGDALLQAIVKRLDGCDLGLSTTARLGGDNFALYSLHAISVETTRGVSEKLAEILEMPFDLDGIRAQIGVRIGVSPVPRERSAPAVTGLVQAELALDSATLTGGSHAATFDPESFAHQERAREIEKELWSALDRNEFHIAYQPQVSLSDGAVVGAEALIRWEHPKFGAISPAEFIEIAEANGFVEKLGLWILHRACKDALDWPDEMSVSVNVSPIQLTHAGFVHDVKSTLQQTGLTAQRLHLEFTESVFINSSENLLGVLRQLRELGISFALDDFGTGFSSFGYLTRFPLDAIKLDQMFVRNITTDHASQAIVQSIKALADGLELTLICEGVESDEQLQFLRLIGCQQGQGYLFGKPQSSADLSRIFRPENALAG